MASTTNENAKQDERQAIRFGIFKGLHVIVNVDRNCAGAASEVAANHQDDTELTQCMGEAQDQRGDHARDRHGQDDVAEGAQSAGAENRGSVEQFAIDALK